MSNRRKSKVQRMEQRARRCSNCGSREFAEKQGYGLICMGCNAKVSTS